MMPLKARTGPEATLLTNLALIHRFGEPMKIFPVRLALFQCSAEEKQDRRSALVSAARHMLGALHDRPSIQSRAYWGGWMLLAWATSPNESWRIGVDLAFDVGETEVSNDEIERLWQLIPRQELTRARPATRAAFYSAWTELESRAKALGTGLGTDFASIAQDSAKAQIVALEPMLQNALGTASRKMYASLALLPPARNNLTPIASVSARHDDYLVEFN